MPIDRQDNGYSTLTGKDVNEQRPYSYVMKIKVDDELIPDPAKWTYQVGDLDTSGSRDATGLLHRAYVTTKVNYEFEWNGIGWETLEKIVSVVQKEKFKLTAPDPRTFNTPYTGDYYVGDRTGSCDYFLAGKPGVATYSLKLKFIEY